MMPNIFMRLGSTQPQRQISLIGLCIGICWVVIYILVRGLGGYDEAEQVHRYALGDGEGSLLIQLFTYAFAWI